LASITGKKNTVKDMGYRQLSGYQRSLKFLLRSAEETPTGLEQFEGESMTIFI